MKTKICILFFAIFLVIGVWIIGWKNYQNERIEIKEIEAVKIIDANSYFIFEDFRNPEITSLIKREGLTELFNKSDKEFQGILRVKNWVKEQLGTPGDPDPYPPWNAETILSWARSGKSHPFCGQFAIVFAQALTGLGIPVRYVDIQAKDGNSHFVTEVWSRDFNKWIVIDPYFDRYYETQDMPLNALEISRAGRAAVLPDVKIVSGTATKKAERDDLQSFYEFAIILRNNHWDHPVHIHETVTAVNKNLSSRLIWGDASLQYQGIQSEPLFYWKPDICNIKVVDKDQKRGILTIEFNTLLTPTSEYLVISNGQKDIVQSKYTWKLNPGYNRLEVIPIKGNFDMQSTIVAILR